MVKSGTMDSAKVCGFDSIQNSVHYSDYPYVQKHACNILHTVQYTDKLELTAASTNLRQANHHFTVQPPQYFSFVSSVQCHEFDHIFLSSTNSPRLNIFCITIVEWFGHIFFLRAYCCAMHLLSLSTALA